MSESFRDLASYRRCTEHIHQNWPHFQEQRKERLAQQERTANEKNIVPMVIITPAVSFITSCAFLVVLGPLLLFVIIIIAQAGGFL